MKHYHGAEAVVHFLPFSGQFWGPWWVFLPPPSSSRAEEDAAALLGGIVYLSVESCPGQLCAKNVNNFAAAALHVKSLTLRYFIQLGFFLSLFLFLFCL